MSAIFSFRVAAAIGLMLLGGASAIEHLDALGDKKMNGYAFTNGRNSLLYTTKDAVQSLENMANAGAKMVHITGFGFQETTETEELRFATNEDNLRLVIQNCHAAGMQVFFKPVIEVRGRVWRGLIPGSEGWFASYRGFIHRMAEIAEEEEVELFAVGSEYRDASQQVDQWRSVIRTVKTAYSGPLTYVVNHDAFEGVEFFDDLDLVSISAYQSLLPDDEEGTTSPSEAEVRQLWEGEVAKVGDWLQANFPEKKLLVAEIGVQSRGEGLAFRKPWDWEAPGELNLEDQANYYQGFLSAFLSKKWCAGVNIWNWEANPNAGSPGTREETWYTPQNKPAGAVAKKFFEEYDM